MQPACRKSADSRQSTMHVFACQFVRRFEFLIVVSIHPPTLPRLTSASFWFVGGAAFGWPWRDDSARRDRPSRLTDRNAHATIGHHDRTDDEVRAVGSEACDNFSDLPRIGRATDRRLGTVLGEKFSAVLPEVVEEIRHDVADADRVDAHAMLDRLKRLGTG
jgi:hypothetical protein